MDKSHLRKFISNPDLTSYEDRLAFNAKIESLITELKNKKANETDVIYNIKGKKGDMGPKPEFGVDYWTPEQIKEVEHRIKEEITPVKGEDYFTVAEIKEFALHILQNATPVKGRDYNDGKDGTEGKQGLQGDRGPMGPMGKKGDKGDDGKSVTPEELMEEIKRSKTFQIEKKNIKGFDMSDQRWHGSGSSTGGSGDVTGPGSSVDNALARFDGTTGKIIQNSSVIVSDGGSMTGIQAITANGSITAKTGFITQETGGGTDLIGIIAPSSIVSSYTLTLPVDDGNNLEVLQTNGSGVLSWVAQSGGGGSPGGSDTQLQFNNSGSFGGANIDYTEPDATTVQLKSEDAVTTGQGTTFNILAGNGGDVSGVGGAVIIKGGESLGQDSGGNVEITGGQSASDNGGSVNLTSGASVDDGIGGDINITAVGGGTVQVSSLFGSIGINGGAIALNAGNDGFSGYSVIINSGTGIDSDAGPLSLLSGSVDIAGNGNGGVIHITAGNAGGVSGNGGDVIIQSGTAPAGNSGNTFILNLPSSDPGIPGALYQIAGVLMISL